MKIKNSFVEESFVWNGHSDDDFRNAAKHLNEVVAYLHDWDEPIYGQDDLYSREILQDMPIYSFYERDEEDPLNDEKQMVIFPCKVCSTREKAKSLMKKSVCSFIR